MFIIEADAEKLRELYRGLCEKEDIPLFSQAWWLDAAAGEKGWNVFLCANKERITGSLPYTKRWGIISQPVLTQTAGPWVWFPEGQKPATATSWEYAVTTCLISAILKERAIYFKQRFHHRRLSWLPFYWNGFTQTTRYTYRLDDLSDMEKIWTGMDGEARSNIRKAQKQLHVINISFDEFYTLNKRVYEKQKIQPPYSKVIFERIDSCCLRKNSKTILGAYDSQGKIHATAYCIHDNSTAYYLAGGVSPTGMRGAMNLCLWEALNHYGLQGLSFDFEGSMIQSIETFFRKFGARAVPYHSITYYYTPWKHAGWEKLLAKRVKSLAGRLWSR